MQTYRKFIILVVLGIFGSLLIAIWRFFDDPRTVALMNWGRGNSFTRETLVTVQRESCQDAPFILPADGYIGLLYGDPRGPYSTNRPHQGIDIFSDSDPGITPVYAAYDGYITREDEWVSTLIQRIPDDPLNPGRQIWLYYTHMANEAGNAFIETAFPRGTRELFVEKGTLLGYTGDYNGNSARGIWTHLHFSIVKDDGVGRYLNELDFLNSIDPSAYLGRALNFQCGANSTACGTHLTCSS
jgi:murein DD-endopeptidase MepM/ murein hydrolase activator NlpD